MIDWLQQHGWLLAIISLGIFLVAMVLGLVVVVRMPADQFTRPKESDPSQASASHLGRKIAKNVIGGLLLIAGVVLSLPLVPGPGLVMLLVGLSLTDIPGKRKLQMKVLRCKWVLGPVNWIRAKAGQPPLKMP